MYTIHGMKWPFMCSCAVKKLLTHSCSAEVSCWLLQYVWCQVMDHHRSQRQACFTGSGSWRSRMTSLLNGYGN